MSPLARPPLDGLKRQLRRTRDHRSQGQASGTDQKGYEDQLAGMKMFWEPDAAVAFANSDEAFQAMDDVREFSFKHGLLGEGAPSADFIGIAFPGGKVLGDKGNIKLRFDTTYMQMADDGEL